MKSTNYTQVEYRISFYGQATITYDNALIHCGQTDIDDIFQGISPRITDQYINGCTIFYLGRLQMSVLKELIKKKSIKI